LLLCVLAVFLIPAPDQADAQGRWVVCIKLDQPHDPGDVGKCYRCALTDSGGANELNPASPGNVCGNTPGVMKRAFTTRTLAMKFIQDNCGCWYTSGDDVWRLPDAAAPGNSATGPARERQGSAP
jgi:hypothetical protein